MKIPTYNDSFRLIIFTFDLSLVQAAMVLSVVVLATVVVVVVAAAPATVVAMVVVGVMTLMGVLLLSLSFLMLIASVERLMEYQLFFVMCCSSGVYDTERG